MVKSYTNFLFLFGLEKTEQDEYCWFEKKVDNIYTGYISFDLVPLRTSPG